MEYEDIYIYPSTQLKQVGLTALTKPLSSEDTDWLIREFHRINTDPERLAMIGHDSGSFILFVNDQTEGVFDRLGDE